MAAIVAYANRTRLRRLLLSKGIKMPPIKDTTLRHRTRYHVWYPTYFMLWRDSTEKHHRAAYHLINGQPYLKVDNKDLSITMAEVERYGLYKEEK